MGVGLIGTGGQTLWSELYCTCFDCSIARRDACFCPAGPEAIARGWMSVTPLRKVQLRDNMPPD
ncbi:hypothetical protein RLO149_c012700 [Roseobacter litoralis Och 149]|uniref:Uncharacterized protein n=1 Tax=Roseobacter litoralis (strain ATCC 49566 / DSM 6996 / JCM 21268 / NBRC 15278 / OCh 149) TaxID=391595 RepID=F7ZD63_ROSLO|nr:hypothetical protein RLO149_c012700 [Roseobacter litoralis Och 149]